MEYYYHQSIKNYTIALLDLFNDIQVPRFNSIGEKISEYPVSIKFGHRNKAFLLNEHDIENLTNGNVNVLPRMILEYNGMSKAPERDTNKNHKINKKILDSNDLVAQYHYNSRAYDFNFTLHIATRTFTDNCIIVEQIAPIFNPDYTIKIREVDNQEVPTSIPVTIGEFDTDLPEPEPDDIRIIRTSLPITLKGNLYLPIKEQKIIRNVKIGVNYIESERDKKGELYEFDTLASVLDEDSNKIDYIG